MKLILFAFAVLIACNSGKRAEEPKIPFAHEIYGVKLGDSVFLTLYAEVKGPESDSLVRILRNVDNIEMQIFDDNTHAAKQHFDKINITFIPADSNFGKYALFAQETIDANQIDKPSDMDYKLIFSSDGKKYYSNRKLDKADMELKYIPFMNCSSQVCEFGVDVLRLKPGNDGEMYFPSSETAILIIRNSKGDEIYNSSEGMLFAQALQPVFPEQAGGRYRYSKSWNGSDKNGKPVEPQRLSVQLILPHKPKAYMTQFNIEWRR